MVVGTTFERNSDFFGSLKDFTFTLHPGKNFYCTEMFKPVDLVFRRGLIPNFLLQTLYGHHIEKNLFYSHGARP